MSNKVLKPKKASLYEFTQNYSNSINNCIEFFKSMKWPDEFSCDHYGCHKYYLVERVGKTKTSYGHECSSCHKQQLILGILSTDKENNYPRFIKLRLITDYSLVIAPVVAELCTTSVALSAPPNSYQNNSQS